MVCEFFFYLAITLTNIERAYRDAWTKAEDEGVTAPQAREKYVARLKEVEPPFYLHRLHL